MASAQVGNRLAAASGPASPTRLRPAPPAPVPPTAPTVPERTTPAPEHRQTPARRAGEAGVAHPSVRSRRVASLVAAIAVTLAVVGGVSWLGQAVDPGIPERTAVIRVGAGETVWDVAARVAPHSDQRAVVERIRQLNGMAGTAVRPDQQLQVPDGR